MDEGSRQLIRQRILDRVCEVRSFPQFVVETLQKLDDPESSARDVAVSLSKDQGLVVRILKLANSAYFGLPRSVSSVAEAIPLLGYPAVKNLVVAASVYKVMNKPFSGYALDVGELWRHSLSVACSARYLATRMGACNPEVAYLVGLLHAVGKIVLNDYMKFGYQIVIRIVENENVPFMEAERAVLGFDHAQVGGMLMEKWNFPESHKHAVEYQYEPDSLPEKVLNDQPLTDVLHLANGFCLMLGVGAGADGLLYPLSEKALMRLGICDYENVMAELVDLIEVVSEEFEEIEA